MRRRGRTRPPTSARPLGHALDAALVHPGELAAELARVADELGVEIFERSPVRGPRYADRGRGRLVTRRGSRARPHVALATNVFPSLLKRNRLMTVPVYDYVLMTEPLTHEQLAEIGWSDRQGIGDMANQFHYYRLTADDRILFGGYDAIYHCGRRVRAGYEDRPATFRELASHFFTTFPQLEGLRFTPPLGRRDRHQHPVLRVLRHGPRRPRRLRGRLHRARRRRRPGSRPTSCSTCSGRATERTALEMVREAAAAVPARARGIHRHQPDPLVARPRRPHRGQAQLLLKTLDALGLGFDS